MQVPIVGERRTIEADLRPVHYPATLLGQAEEVVLRWFILVGALLLDPAAVWLLFAATAARSVPSQRSEAGCTRITPKTQACYRQQTLISTSIQPWFDR